MKSNMQSNTADTACRSFRGRRKRLDSAVTGRKGLPASDAETADMISFLRAAEGWYGREEITGMKEAKESEEVSVSNKARRKAWARLLAKVYEIDIFTCPKCGGEMSVIAVIRNPDEIRGIIACLERQGRGPPKQQINRKNPGS